MYELKVFPSIKMILLVSCKGFRIFYNPNLLSIIRGFTPLAYCIFQPTPSPNIFPPKKRCFVAQNCFSIENMYISTHIFIFVKMCPRWCRILVWLMWEFTTSCFTRVYSSFDWQKATKTLFRIEIPDKKLQKNYFVLKSL